MGQHPQQQEATDDIGERQPAEESGAPGRSLQCGLVEALVQQLQTVRAQEVRVRGQRPYALLLKRAWGSPAPNAEVSVGFLILCGSFFGQLRSAGAQIVGLA